jgi:hypothetical protein
MSLSTESERRKHRRAVYSNPLHVQTVSSSKTGNVFEVKNQAFPAHGRDISEGGFGVNLPSAFKPGAILKIIFKVGIHDENESEAYVRVVWTRQDNHGLQFLMLEDSTLRKIRGYIGNAENAV